MRRPRFTVLAVPIVAALALIASGCGGGDKKASSNGGSASQTPQAILDAVKPAGTNAGPQKVDLKISFAAKGTPSNPQLAAILDKPITLSLTGPAEPKKADLTYDVVAGPLTLNGGLRLLDDKAWVQVAGTWYELPVDTSGTTTAAGSAASVDPAKALDAIGKPSALIKNLSSAGSETIEGVETDHVSGDLDIPAFLAAAVRAAGTVNTTSTPVGADQIAQARAAVEKYITSSKADVWVGKEDKLLHKLAVTAVGTLTGEIKTQTGLDGFDAALSVQATPTSAVSVTAPADAKPASDLAASLGPLLGGLGSLGSSSP